MGVSCGEMLVGGIRQHPNSESARPWIAWLLYPFGPGDDPLPEGISASDKVKAVRLVNRKINQCCGSPRGYTTLSMMASCRFSVDTAGPGKPYLLGVWKYPVSCSIYWESAKGYASGVPTLCVLITDDSPCPVGALWVPDDDENTGMGNGYGADDDEIPCP